MSDFVAPNTEYMEGKLKILWFPKITNVKEVQTVLPIVAVYDDRLEVTSPGGLYNGLTYEEVMNGHSKIRNKGIANIFSQMGLVEAYSTFEGYAFHLK